MVKKSSAKTTKKTAKTAQQPALQGWLLAPRKPTTMDDVKSAILLVSLTINLAFFITWLVLRLTNAYDAQVYSILFNR